MEERKFMKIKSNKWLLVIVTLAILLAGLYIFYDQYFKLPIATPPSGEVANGEDNGENEYKFGKFNILILGLDGREELNDRTDTIILASLDQQKKVGQLLSIPRDSRVKIKGEWHKINAAYVYGGVDLTKKTVSDLLGVNIDRYVIINFKGLIKLADMVGGVDIDVPVRMYKPLEGIDLQPGQQHLDGEQVLAYARFRGTREGDIGRAKRQQEIITLLAGKILDGKNLNHFLDIVDSAVEEVETDMTVREIVALARLASPVLENGIATKVLPGDSKKIDSIWYWEPDLTDLTKILAVSKRDTVVPKETDDTNRN